MQDDDDVEIASLCFVSRTKKMLIVVSGVEYEVRSVDYTLFELNRILLSPQDSLNSRTRSLS